MKKKIINNYIKKYTYRVEWSEDDDLFIARALELQTILAHGKTPAEALKELQKPLALALEMMLEDNEELPEPFALQKFKGKFLIRTSPERHKELTVKASESGISVNQYILNRL